eukprot:2376428-Pleurochrysis_carterae.AAC.1
MFRPECPTIKPSTGEDVAIHKPTLHIDAGYPTYIYGHQSDRQDRRERNEQMERLALGYFSQPVKFFALSHIVRFRYNDEDDDGLASD